MAKERILAVGDTHGCRKTLMALIDQFDLRKQDTLVMLGDYVDRGPDSKGVIQFLVDLRKEGYDVRCLIGNHESTMLDAVRKYHQVNIAQNLHDKGLLTDGHLYLKNYCSDSPKGLGKALSQWAVNSQGVIEFPLEHLDFFSSLLPWLHFENRGLIFVHAGMSAEALAKESATEAIKQCEKDTANYGYCPTFWTRKTIHIAPKFQGLIIHGHSPYQSLRRKYYSFKDSSNDDVVSFWNELYEVDLPKIPRVLRSKLNLEVGICCNNAKVLTGADVSDPDNIQIYQQTNLDM